jgi:hypothetical protein
MTCKAIFKLWWYNAVTRHVNYLRTLRTRREGYREAIAAGRNPEIAYASFLRWPTPKITRADMEWGAAEAKKILESGR